MDQNYNYNIDQNEPRSHKPMIVIILVVVIVLGIYYYFTAGFKTLPEFFEGGKVQKELTPEEVLKSLSVPEDQRTTEASQVSDEVIKSLSVPAGSENNDPLDQEERQQVIDSLSVPF